MTLSKKKFLRQADKVAFDLKHRKTIAFNMGKFFGAVERGLSNYSDLEAGKDFLSQVKDYVVENLPFLLEKFVNKCEQNGGVVEFAESPEEVLNIIDREIKIVGAEYIVKSKSMTSEEVGLNEHLEKQKVESIETDLGEFIVQIAGEKPYHIVTPAMHKSKKDVAEIFADKFSLSPDADAHEITLFVREYLRKKFVRAQIGVTGANFLLAEEGATALTENEGNGVMSVSFPRTHIVIAGIEKIIPSIDYLPYFWPILAHHATGQTVSVYNSLFFGAKRPDEPDGPERFVVILLNNNRHKLFKNKILRESLKCIRCGSCLNNCPVYRNIGGYTYESVYSGPIGSVISPHLFDFNNFIHLSSACTLCGKCYETCPVKIDLPSLLLYNRNLEAKSEKFSFYNIAFDIFSIVYSKRFYVNLIPVKLINFASRTFKSAFRAHRRSFPVLKRFFNKRLKIND